MGQGDERFFTVEEANGELATLRKRLARIREARVIILRSASVVRRHARRNGGGIDGTAYLEAMRVLRQELEALAGQGIILRDADAGLVDFPSRREGRAVYLCWRSDEERVDHWHEVNAGFTGRKPLEG
jgi:hypothetical protein